MRSKWLQLVCLCAALQFQLVIGKPSSRGYESTARSTPKSQWTTEAYEDSENDSSDSAQQRSPARSTICTIKTNYYDCQLQNVHIKEGESHDFGLEHNPEQNIAFQDSTLEYLPKSLIDAFPNLTMLNLNDLIIGSIEPNAFANAVMLETLYLQGNRLTGIPRRTFHGTFKLQTLVLSNNEIEVFKYDFESNANLQILYLDQNQLTTLPSFTNTAFLQFLNASHNKIQFINENQLSNVRNLKTLDVSFNELKQLNLQQLHAYLDLVDVSFNELTGLTMPPNVKELNARNNSLKGIVVSNQCTLITLNLACNELETQPNLDTCNLMEYLDMSHNLLESFHYRISMSTLKKLNLRHNHLFEINLPIMSIPKTPSLKFLDISHNELSYGPSLSLFVNLNSVQFNNNHLVSLKSYNMPKMMKFLRMSNNEWKCDDFKNIEHLIQDKNDFSCPLGLRYVNGICCKDYNRAYNDVLNEKLYLADFHERKLKQQCPKQTSTTNKQGQIDNFRQAALQADANSAAKLNEIATVKISADNWRTKLDDLSNYRRRLDNSKGSAANEIEKQRKFYHVTKEGLLSGKDMLQRVIKFVKDRNTFNKDLLKSREQETAETIKLIFNKETENTNLNNNNSDLSKKIYDLKKDEKSKKKYKDSLEKQLNKNAPSIHGTSGTTSL